MFILKKILKIFFSFLFLGGLVFLFFFARDNQELVWEKIQEQVDSKILPKSVLEKTLPPETNPQEHNFTWTYAGREYAFSKTLFGSTLAFYQKSPKAYNYNGELPVNWEEDYYELFFQKPAGENTIPEVAEKIRELGLEKKLTDDQIVELVLSFVQAIPYDDAKAESILQNGQEFINYPYETLFLKSGVCSDKSILAADILNSLGYGTALFTYETEKHMDLVIKCPMEYSQENSGYCYAETTSIGFKIGMIPDFDQKNRAVANQELKNFEETQFEQFDYKRLGTPKIFQKREGKFYNGISKTIAIAKEIDSLKISIQNLARELSASKKEIEDQQKKLKDLTNDLNKLKKAEKYDEYNEKVDDYNDLAKDYKKDIDKYNSLIKTYNQKVSRYNYLIKIF